MNKLPSKDMTTQEQERIGAIMRDQFLVASPEFTLVIGKYFAGLSGELDNIAADLRAGSKDTHCTEMNIVSILPSNPVVAQREIEDFTKDFLSRFQCYSAESFSASYEDKGRATELFRKYVEVITEALAMSGAPGYARPKATDQELWLQVGKQQELRAELNALDEERTAAKHFQEINNLVIGNNA